MLVEKCISKSGLMFDEESECAFADEIYDKCQDITKLKSELKVLKNSCQHSIKVAVEKSQSVRTILNPYGEECGEVYQTQSYTCKICGCALYHNITDDNWSVW